MFTYKADWGQGGMVRGKGVGMRTRGTKMAWCGGIKWKNNKRDILTVRGTMGLGRNLVVE